MTAKDFLELVASLTAQRIPGNRAHLAAYASPLAGEVPKHLLTTAVAEAIADAVPDRPKLGELVALIRREAAHMPAGAAAPVERRGDSPEAWDARWFDYAVMRVGEGADTRLLLSRLRSRSMSAWERFAEIHAPRELEEHRDREREIADRRAGRIAPLPRVGVPTKPLHRAAPAPRGPIVTTRPPQPVAGAYRPRSQDAAFNDLLRAQAEAGDHDAAQRLEYRTGQRVRVIEHAP